MSMMVPSRTIRVDSALSLAYDDTDTAMYPEGSQT